jgi:hypothetical protein
LRANLPVVIISCQVLQEPLRRLLPESLAQQATFMDYGLHETPRKSTGLLQEAIDAVAEPSLIVLGYGLCGNLIKGLQAGPHTLLIPRVDDCIPLLLGSYEAHQREFKSVPGTYYLNRGWLEAGSNPLQEYEAYVERYGEKKALYLMDVQYHNYDRLALVGYNQAELEQYRPQAQEVARFCERWDMRYEELLGSDGYVRQLVDLVQGWADGDHQLAVQADGDFVVVAPGGEVLQEQFVRW